MTETAHIQNQQLVADMINDIAGRTMGGDAGRLASLLVYCLGRVLIKNAKANGETLGKLPLEDRYLHIADWLLAAVRNAEPWLEDLDDKGRPKKLMKFSSVDGIVKEADKSMRKFAQRQRNIKLAEGDEELAAELADGWYVVRLLTPESLDRESGQMQHCIGQGGYDGRLANRNFAYYSLRDPAGHPHATIEVNTSEKRTLQFQGKQNDEPLPEYIDRALEFMKAADIRVSKLSATSRWVFDTDFKRHDVSNLPDGVALAGPVEVAYHEKIAFPRKVTVIGDFKITVCDVTAMPEELTVSGKYTVRDAVLRTIPKTLTMLGESKIVFAMVDEAKVAEKVVGVGRLVYADCDMAFVPEGLNGESSVLFDKCRGFSGTEHLSSLYRLQVTECTEMPITRAGFTTRNLDVSSTPCQIFSSQINFEGDVTMRDCGLVRLPENLEVRGSLDVSRNPLNRIPPSIRVGGELIISRTSVQVIPREIGTVLSLKADHTPLRSLDGVSVKTHLDVKSSKVEEIPDGFRIDGNLNMENTCLSRIGVGVRIGRHLNTSRTSLERLPDDIFVGNGLDASYSSLQELPADFSTNGDLNLRGSDLRTLPEGLVVKGDLDISTTGITGFPEGVVIEGNLVCRETLLKTVAEDTVVKGKVIHPAGNGVFPNSPERMIFEMATAPTVPRGPTP